MYREDFLAHQWTPSVPTNYQYVQQERQWLLLENKVAVLHVYVACSTTRDTGFFQWNSDLFQLITSEMLLLKSSGFRCVAFGDFNTRVGCMKGLEGNNPSTNENYPLFIPYN